MPAHVKAMLNGVSLQVPVVAGKLALGIWQAIYLVEHRRKPHSREVIFQFLGSRKS
jgi:secondary thiamine-phosphate synthase enzyme